MNENSGVFFGGLQILGRNKRYVIWFYILNLLLALLGAAVFGAHAHAVLDKSLYSQGLLQRFDVFVFLDLLSQPEMGNVHGFIQPAVSSAYLFIFFSILFMPGVLDGFASERRISREDFWATCGRNVWRFVRLFIFNLIIAGISFAVLSGATGALGKAAGNSTNEKLPFYVELIGGIIIFLVMTWIRIWFDLAEANVVISDEGRVRKSMRIGARLASRGFGRLLGPYVLIAIFAVVVLVLGLWLWDAAIPPGNVVAAFVVGQAILFLWLIARFWQRACAVVFCLKETKECVAQEVVPLSPPSAAPTPIPEAGPAI